MSDYRILWGSEYWKYPVFIWSKVGRFANGLVFKWFWTKGNSDRTSNDIIAIQARIAQLVAYGLDTGEVPRSNPGKDKNFSVKISNWIVRI